MPREPMQLPANLAQMRLERMMVKSSSTTGTNGLNLNLVMVPKLGGKSTSTTSTLERLSLPQV